jgi:uncharacterized delta-60 repeat protein
MVGRLTASGQDDHSFSGDGYEVTDLPLSTDERAEAVAIDSQGRVVVAGYATLMITGRVMMVARYTSSGALDTTFGQGGVALADFTSSTSEQANGLAIDSNGRIVVAGSANVGGTSTQFALARFTTSGSLDTTFTSNGKVLTDFASSTSEAAADVVISGTKIVVAGAAVLSTTQFALARYNSDGSLDSSFSGDGKALGEFVGAAAGAWDLAIDSLGRVVAAGYAMFNANDRRFAIARYSSSGALDSGYSGDGLLIINFTSSSQELATSVAVDSSNRVIAGGYAGPFAGTGFQFAEVRTTANGALDSTFSGDGKDLIDVDTLSEHSNGMALTSSGKIILAGQSFDGSDTHICVVRSNSNGTLDTTFGTGGVADTVDLNFSPEVANNVTIDGSGRVVIAGHANFLFD